MSKYTKKLNKKKLKYKKKIKKNKKTKKYKLLGGTTSIMTCTNNCYRTNVIRILFHAFTNSNEICGCAIEYDNKFLLYREYNDGEQGNCYYTNKYNIIWHTHPYTSKQYPSSTDLLKVIKYEHTISFIFCIFGLWTIKFEEQRNNTVIDNITKKFKEKNNPGHIYYKSTNRGMQPTAISIYNYIQNIKQIVNNELGYVNNPGFELTFNYWKNHPRMSSMPIEIPDIPEDHIALAKYFTPINPEELFY